MNETDLTKKPEVQRISKPDFLTIGIGAAGFAAACAIIAYFFQEDARQKNFGEKSFCFCEKK